MPANGCLVAELSVDTCSKRQVALFPLQFAKEARSYHAGLIIRSVAGSLLLPLTKLIMDVPRIHQNFRGECGKIGKKKESNSLRGDNGFNYFAFIIKRHK